MSILSFLAASKTFSYSVFQCFNSMTWGVLFCSYLLLWRLLILFTKGLGNFLLLFVEIMVYVFTMVLFFESDNSKVKCFSGVARISLPMFLFFSHISQTLLGDPAILLHLPALTLWFSYDPFYWIFLHFWHHSTLAFLQQLYIFIEFYFCILVCSLHFIELFIFALLAYIHILFQLFEHSYNHYFTFLFWKIFQGFYRCWIREG